MHDIIKSNKMVVEASSLASATALKRLLRSYNIHSGVFGPCARLHQTTGETCSGEYLLQRLSTTVQSGNTAAVLGTAEASPQLYMAIQSRD